uniref:Reverse transcriptase Ty1/copia-type domain-containing protein n=1 Tax=Solanum demissum TaxID=50514 RepID=Q6L3U4_SOLDE|nr:hypothetical protein SDM1_34t00015 [Solanum demissum]
MYILVYVIDILITGNYPNLVTYVINSLAYKFSLKNLGELNYLLGIEVKHVPNGIVLSQSRYILEILSYVDMTDCKGVTTPMCSSLPPKAADGSPSADAILYRRTIGKLQYLSFTRPDIAFAVNKLSRFMQSPSLEHWKAVKRVLRYLKALSTPCLQISSHSDFNLYMYSDADWAAVTMYILVYVIDILITGNYPNLVTYVINSLAYKFSLKNLGELNYLLGIEVKHVPNGIVLSQSRYILDILSYVHMTDCKGVTTPTCSSLPLKAADATLYRCTIGKLQYLSFTRPDIAFAVNKLSRFMQSPSLEHWKAVKRVLRYLKALSTPCLQIPSHSDCNLYMYSDADWAAVTMYILVYVIDILITGNYPNLVTYVINSLAYKFSLKNLSELNYLLGIEVKHVPNGIVLSQSRYILEILSYVDMTDCKGVTTPMCSSLPPKAADGSPSIDATLYRRTIGKLQYLSFTRPDIAFAVNKLSRFMQSPSLEHWKAVKRVLRYLKALSTPCLQISSHSDCNLYMYSDADWAVYVVDILITGNYPNLVTYVINSLAYKFSLKNLGEINYLLGIEVKHVPNGIVLSQSRYILEILSYVDMTDCKGVTTPMCSSLPPKAADGSPSADATLYRRTIGKLQYLSFTRPDIAFAVNKLSRFMQSPSLEHWKAVKRVFRYLKALSTPYLQISSHSDCNLYMYSDADWAAVTMYILVYVIDILITGNYPNLVTYVINSLAYKFSLKNLGELNYLLGIEVKHVPNGIVLSQSRYILEILSYVDMTDCKGVTTPMCSSLPPKAADGSPSAYATLYRRTIGKLQYLSFTRPDIAFAVNKLSRFMQSPSLEHWKAVKRVLRYLKALSTPCLQISSHSDCNLYMYSDADWAGANLICWSSKKQLSVARSSIEAEYKSVANALFELTWVHNFFTELQYQVSQMPSIFCDNIGVSYLSKNPVFHTKMKHIAVDFHYLRNSVNSGRSD